MFSSPVSRSLVLGLIGAVALAGCFTGERPSFEDDGDSDQGALVSTGNADIDVVLDRLESAESSTFTAGYAIETKFGSLSSMGTVVQTDDDERSVTIEHAAVTTRFLSTADGDQTCNLVTSECESSLNDARISDVGIPHTFFGPSFATRLRVSADRRIGESNAYSKPIAGEDARCVDVTVAGGTETFCALDSGVLAQFVGADVTVDLTSYSPEPDTTQLTV